MEKARLDRQLKLYERDCARQEFSVERQKRSLVTKWHGVSMTTGHSDKALPPDGPQDNVYEKSKHSKSRLSEKRLMEWKVSERQLDKFLRQFQVETQTTPSALRPRPSSSQALMRTAKRTEHQGHVSSKSPGQFRVRSAGCLRQSDVSMPKKRCASAVSFSSRAEVISTRSHDDTEVISPRSHDDTDNLLSADEQDSENEEDGSTKGLHVFQSRLKSLSAATFRRSQSYQQEKKGQTTKPRSGSDADLPLSHIAEETWSPLLPTTLSASQVAENVKCSHGSQNYKAFLRARAFSGTTFFVTKDNVVMTNTFQRTCKQLHVNGNQADSVEDTRREEDDHSPRVRQSDKIPSTEKLSVSSYSSEDLADSVFAEPNVGTHSDMTDAEDIDLALRDVDELSSTCRKNLVETEDFNVYSGTNLGDRNSEKLDSDTKALQPDIKTVEERPTTEPQHTNGHSMTCQKVRRSKDQKVLSELTVQDLPKKEDSTARVPSVSGPMKKLTIVEKREVNVNDECQAASVVQCRRHSVHPPSHSSTNNSRRHSLFVNRESADSSQKTLLMKRRQSSTAVFRTHTLTHAKPSSIASAMTVKPLLAREGRQLKEKSHTPGHDLLDTSATSLTKSPGTNENTHPFSQGHGTRIPSLSREASHNLTQDSSQETGSNSEDHQPSHRYRDLALEQPAGLSPSVSSLGTVIKAAMVFSKAARRRALSTMVRENNEDTREAIRKERLRKLQSRASVLSKIVAQFPVHGDE